MACTRATAIGRHVFMAQRRCVLPHQRCVSRHKSDSARSQPAPAAARTEAAPDCTSTPASEGSHGPTGTNVFEFADGSSDSSADEMEEVIVYSSPVSPYLSAGMRLASASSLLAAAGSVTAATQQFSKFASLQELSAVSMGMETAAHAPSLDLRTAAFFGVLALVGRVVSHALADRSVIEIRAHLPAADARVILTDTSAEACARVDPSDPWRERTRRLECVATALDPKLTATHALTFVHPNPWGGKRESLRVPRSSVSCAPPNTLTQCLLVTQPSGRRSEQYLLPWKGWYSAAPAYLKSLLYTDYFNAEEKAPAPDVELITIEGFGPYRPAQFADPLHPKAAEVEQRAEQLALAAQSQAAQARSRGRPGVGSDAVPALPMRGGFGELLLPVTTQKVPVPGTPFYLQGGAIWSEFKPGRNLSFEEKRALERDVKLHGSTRARVDALPAPSSPVSLMLDASQHTLPRTSFIPALLPETTGEVPVQLAPGQTPDAPVAATALPHPDEPSASASKK